tara:strand:+ start:4106 stop:4999 length:894 start_codon:yes stop_codon:yes gene_type:complete
MPHYSVYSFYRFNLIGENEKIKKQIISFTADMKIKGTILLANEGINGSIAGNTNELNLLIRYLKKLLKIRKINLKMNKINFIPFNRFKVRIKKEIVSLGQGNIDVSKNSGKIVQPADWDRIVQNKEFKIIDTRNKFEIKIGSFANSLSPGTTSFREFPKKFDELKIDKKTKIAMFCTGGIRCEKASSYLMKKGYKNVYQLHGGILNYLKFKKKQNTTKMSWEGDCFVFDNRVTIDKNLNTGKYKQCYGCRRPITQKDTNSPYYKKGICCPYCYNERSEDQKMRSATRQAQIERRNFR